MFTILARETGSWCNEIRYQYNGIRSIFHFPKEESFESAEQRLKMILTISENLSKKVNVNKVDVNKVDVNHSEVDRQEENDSVDTAKENGSHEVDKKVPEPSSGRSAGSVAKPKRIRQNSPDGEDKQKG